MTGAPTRRSLGGGLLRALAWGAAAYVLTSVRIELPGPFAYHTDFTEVALLGAALFLDRAWLTLVACAVEALNVVPPADLRLSFETTFLMHAVAVPCAFYARRALQRRNLIYVPLGLAWSAFIVGYYFLLLVPMLLATMCAFVPPELQQATVPGLLAGYLRVAAGARYEVVLTAGVTAFAFVAAEELRRRRRAEARLGEALGAQRALLASAPMAVVGVGDDGLVSSWNPAAERLFGTPAAEAVGGPPPHFTLRGADDGTPPTDAALDGPDLLAVEGETIDADGVAIPVAVSRAPLRGDTGAPVGTVFLVEDLRERLALRQQVQRHATMSALGQLVGGLAHELRNPLFGISATLDAFGAHMAGQPKLELMNRTLRSQVDQLNALMLDLLDYGKAGVVERSPGALATPLRHALADCAAQAASAGVAIDVALPAGLPRVSMDTSQMVHVFRNLLQNAVAFSPAGGAVRVDGFVEPGGVRVEILDRGAGFREGDLPRVFEPFFSRRSGGTGLGLSIVQRVVEHHGGTVDAGNREGGGARMIVRLPAAPK